MLLFVSYRLNENTDPQEFRKWSRERDIPATRSLPGVSYFAGGSDPRDSGRQIEFIAVDSAVVPDVRAWEAHVAKFMPQEGQDQFAAFVDVTTVQIEAYEEN